MQMDVDEDVRTAIAATLPSGPGNRHRQLFELGRRLKAIPRFANASVQSLKGLVRAWHAAALPFIATKPFEESWADFAESWPKIQYAAGQEPIVMTYQEALAREIPRVANQYEQQELRHLVALCSKLQEEAGEEPFFLAGRAAAELVKVPHAQVARWLRMLVVDGVLELVKQGSRRHASEYRCRGQ